VFFVLTAASAVTNAAPDPFDGRFYEVVLFDGISWQDAKTAAEAMSHQNVQGHLATINTKSENDFIKSLYDSKFPGGNRTEVWIGGSQKGKVNCPSVPNPEPGCGWEWENGETIPVPNNPSSFGWLLGEPSNGPGGAEDNLTFGRGGSAGWNDENQTNNIWGYVVEYGDKLRPFSARNCALNSSDGAGCKLAAGTVNGTVITFPLNEANIDIDATVTVSTQLITNDAARCAPQPPQTPQTLSLFGGDVVVPKYLCGHPDFLVAHVETSSPTGFQINQGVVDILNGNELLAGNLYECQPSGVDPTEADVVGYQSSVGALEKLFPAVDDILVGSVGEFTTACGSSRGSGTGRSYYFAGLRIFPGVGNGAVANPDGNREFRFKLLIYKLDVLAEAVRNACVKAINKGACSSITSQVKVLKADVTNGNDVEAKAHVKNLQKTLKGTKFTIVPGENHSGELNSRIDNIAFTLSKFFP
jgi:hypothetical protein